MTSFSGFEELADDADDFADELRDIDDEVHAALDRAVAETARWIKIAMEGFVPIAEGDLLQSITDPVKTAPLERTIYVEEDYARAIEYGRGPVTITPDKADALRFEIDGRIVYAGKVEQDPVPDQPFVRPAMRGNARRLRREINRELRQVFREATD